MVDFMDLKLLNDEMQYVAWDLKILDALRAGDGYEHTRDRCEKFVSGDYLAHKCRTTCCACDEEHPKLPWVDKKYDSRVVMLLSRTAFLRKLIPHPKANEGFFPEEWEFEWNSSGCRREYEFAKEHHIRVLELEAFLEGIEIDI